MAKKTLTYSEALSEIETILAGMNNEDVDIDSLASQVKRASELIKYCKERLRKAEEDVNRVLEEE